MPDLPDLSNITVRDLRDLEAVLERPIGSLFESLAGGDMSGLSADMLAGLLWLRLRKDDPALEFEGVLDMDLGALGAAGISAAPKVTGAPTP